MRSLYFKLETLNVQDVEPDDDIMWSQGGQSLMLRGCQQAVVCHSPQKEFIDSQVPPAISNLEGSVTYQKLNKSHSSRSGAMVGPYAVNIDFTRSLCEHDCNCACHRMARIKSPRCLNDIFGSLWLGYSAQPWSARTCDSTDCHGRSKSVSYTYAFPRWLLNWMITLRTAYNQSSGPELCVRLVRVRPDDADIFAATWADIEEVAINRIKHLLKHGEASLLDVDQNGLNALQVRSKLSAAHDCMVDLMSSML